MTIEQLAKPSFKNLNFIHPRRDGVFQQAAGGGWPLSRVCGMVALVAERNETAIDHRIEVAGKYFRCNGETWFSKALTYGPFPPGGGLRDGEQLLSDLDAVVELGANTLRIYGVPNEEFVEACRARGLRILITLSWAQHVDFFENATALADARAALIAAVERWRGEPVVLAYLVGNEIPATLVRWMGPRRVRRDLENLIALGRAADADALFSYASYPSTEYLMPNNADFAAYNVFLEDEEPFHRYLLRLQNVAGDKPVMITEFGIDSLACGEAAQAQAMTWHAAMAWRAGLAGSTVFAFSDSWHRGGEEVRGWDFGLYRRDGSAKPAVETLADAWRGIESPGQGLRLNSSPRMSVIVCTYRGAAVLDDCLRSLEKLRYPDFEVVVVNDGADQQVEEIVSKFPAFRHVSQPHGGLSAARNLGAAQAAGEVLVYTDDDCRADRDWLTYLALGLESGEFSAMGGPNVPPPASGFAEACVIAAPGGPAHVLLSDTVAEHLPGCNLAVRRDAFEAIGGFREEFRTAGDDVDFCWRLQVAGFRIGFHPAAWVWHLRRSTVGDYLRQQMGYGRAEALLIPRHVDRFGAIGAARWRGWVYDGAFPAAVEGSMMIYQGIFGYAGYQSIYGGTRGLGYVVSSVQWMLLIAVFAAIGLVFLPIGILAALMFVFTLVTAVGVGRRARLPSTYDTLGARLTISALALLQPLLRGALRIFGSLAFARLPRGLPPLSRPLLFPRVKGWTMRRTMNFWSSDGLTRDEFLAAMQRDAEQQGTLLTAGDGWQDWDLEVLASPFWSEQITTVTEYHSAHDRLTRLRIESRPTLLTILWKVFLAFMFVVAVRSSIVAVGVWGVGLLLPEILRRLRLGRLQRRVLRIASELGFHVAD